MNVMRQLAESKADALRQAVMADPRWRLEDELLCQVFGYTLYGYVFGVGRVVCFMDADDIRAIAEANLVSLGLGARYAAGLVEHAQQEFIKPGNQSLQSRLIGVGHSHFASDDIQVLVDSVFANSENIRKQSG